MENGSVVTESPDSWHGYSDDVTTKQESTVRDRTGTGLDAETVSGLLAVTASNHAPNKLVATDSTGVLPSDIIPSGIPPGGAAGGDLGGTYPSPTVISVADVTVGTLTVSNGGTGDSSLTAHSVLLGEGTASVANTGAGSAGQVLQSNGAASDPAWTSTLSSTVQGNITKVGTVITGVWNGTAVSVANGGTGDTSVAAYSVVCGGTTGAGALQTVSGLGATGQVLTSNGSGALPSFQTPSASGGASLSLISTQNPSSAGSVTFSSLSTGVNYLLIVDIIQNTSGGILRLRFNGDSGANYQWSITGESTGGSADAHSTGDISINLSGGSSLSATYPFHAEINIYGNAGNTIRAFSSSKAVMFTGDYTTNFCGGYWTGAADMTSVSIVPGAGTVTGKVSLYSISQ